MSSGSIGLKSISRTCGVVAVVWLSSRNLIVSSASPPERVNDQVISLTCALGRLNPLRRVCRFVLSFFLASVWFRPCVVWVAPQVPVSVPLLRSDFFLANVFWRWRDCCAVDVSSCKVTKKVGPFARRRRRRPESFEARFRRNLFAIVTSFPCRWISFFPALLPVSNLWSLRLLAKSSHHSIPSSPPNCCCALIGLHSRRRRWRSVSISPAAANGSSGRRNEALRRFDRTDGRTDVEKSKAFRVPPSTAH